MEIRQLRYFLAVYETGSVTAAARRCFISQPSISTAVAALELEVGAPLFVRHRKGVAATPEAAALYPRARSVVDDAVSLKDLFRKGPATDITVGLMRSLDAVRVMRLLEPLTANSDLRVSLVDEDQACDARIVSRRLAREDEAFALLWSEPFVVALPPSHPLTFRSELSLADLKEVRMVARCHCENANAAADLGFRPDVAAVATSEEWALALVAAGVGAAVIPAGVIPSGAHVAVRPLSDPRLRRDVGVAYRLSDAETPALVRILAAVRAMGEATRIAA